MAHFAELGSNNEVLRVIVINNNELLDENGIEQESKGVDFCRNLLGGTWIQTSYNASFRKRFACINGTYDLEKDAFIPPKLYDSWILDEDTYEWKSPVPLPEDGNEYIWNEETQTWELIE